MMDTCLMLAGVLILLGPQTQDVALLLNSLNQNGGPLGVQWTPNDLRNRRLSVNRRGGYRAGRERRRKRV